MADNGNDFYRARKAEIIKGTNDAMKTPSSATAGAHLGFPSVMPGPINYTVTHDTPMDDVLDDSGAVPGFGGNSSANAGDDGPNAHAANPGMGDVAMVDAMAPPTSTHSDGDGDSLAGAPMGGDNLMQFPVLVGAGLVNWKAHVLKLGRELALGVNQETEMRLRNSFIKETPVTVLLLADMDVTESIRHNFLPDAGLTLVSTDLEYPPAETVIGPTDQDSNIYIHRQLDNTKPFPFDDESFDKVIMRRGLCVCPGDPEMWGGCGGVSMNLGVAENFLWQVVRVLRADRKGTTGAFLHGSGGATSLPFWQNACTRLVNRYEGILIIHLAHSTTGHFIGLKIARIT